MFDFQTAYELYSRLKLNILSSDHVNFEDRDDPNKEYLRYLIYHNQYLKFSVIKLFPNDYSTIKNKVALAKTFYISPSEIDRMYYWEYEYLLEEVKFNIKS